MIRKCGIGALVNTNIRSNGQVVFGAMPGVARRLVTFFASPKKVTKERRPEVRRPARARGALRKALHGFPVRQARPMGRETPASPRNDRPLRNSGSKLCLAKGFYRARPQTVLADFSCRFCVTRRLSSGPGRFFTSVTLANEHSRFANWDLIWRRQIWIASPRK